MLKLSSERRNFWVLHREPGQMGYAVFSKAPSTLNLGLGIVFSTCSDAVVWEGDSLYIWTGNRVSGG